MSVLEGVRLSELARCPRACALRGRGASPAEPTARTRRLWARGQMYAWYGWRQFADLHGDDQVEREREIPWPLGTGHADLYVRPTRTLVEVKSSTSPSSAVDQAIRQLRLYLHYDPEAEHGAVYLIDPSDLDNEALFPVELSEQHRAAIDTEVAELAAALDGGPLPACVHASPDACRFSGCQFVAAAWDRWEPPAPFVGDDARVVGLAQELDKAIREERARKAAVVETEEQRRRLQTELGGLLAPGVYEFAGLRVRRTVVAGRETFSLAIARKAGAWTPTHDAVFGPFVRRGSSSERWTLSRVWEDEPPPTPDDFGEEAPF